MSASASTGPPSLRDLNVVVRLDRIRELVDQCAIGSLGPSVYAVIGAERPSYVAFEANGGVVGSRLTHHYARR
jgi:hypothetical protein